MVNVLRIIFAASALAYFFPPGPAGFIATSTGPSASPVAASPGAGTGVNYLSNASFENGATGWTTSSGTFTADTSNYTDGAQSLSASLSSQTGTLSQSITPTQQLVGVNMQATCMIKTTLTNLQLCALVAGSAVNCQTVTASGTWTPVTASIPGVAASTSVGVQIAAASSTTGSYNVDACYVGKAVNTTSGMGYQDWQSFSMTISGTTSAPTLGTNTQTALWRRVGDSMEIAFNLSQTGAGSAGSGAYLFSLPSGFSIDTTKLTTASTAGSTTLNVGANVVGGGQVATGSTGNSSGFSFAEITAYSSTALMINIGTGAGSEGYPFSSGNGSFNFSLSTLYVSFFAKVPILGWGGTQSGYRIDATPASWSGFTSGAHWSTTSTSITDPTVSGTPALTTRQNRNITCSQAASNFPGITCTLPRAGNYYLCASVAAAQSGTGGQFSYFQIYDGTNVDVTGYMGGDSTDSGHSTVSLCTVVNISSISSATTWRIRAATDASGTTFINNPSSSLLNPVEWSLVELDAPMPAPYLTGSVTSTSSAGYHVEYISFGGSGSISSRTVCSSSPCTVYATSVSGVSVTRSGTGSYNVVMPSGEFSAPFVCTGTSGAINVPWIGKTNLNSDSSTNYSFVTVESNGGSGLTEDSSGDLICMGPR